MSSIAIPVWLLALSMLVILVVVVLEAKARWKHDAAGYVREIERLRRDLEEGHKRETEARKDGIAAGWNDALASLRVLTATDHSIIEKGLFSKVTETSNLFLVIAGGEIRAGNLGRQSLSENQLLKFLDTMKIITGVIGGSTGAAVAGAVKTFIDSNRLD